MSRFSAGGGYHGGWSNARSRARQVSTGSREMMMADKKPELTPDEPKFHSEYPYPAPPMGMPLSGADDDEKPKKDKES